MNDTLERLQTDAATILRAAIDAVDPFPLTVAALQRHFKLLDSSSHITLVAAGKGAWPMARGAAAFLGDRLVRGVASGIRGRDTLPASIEWIDGSHPLPDGGSARAAARALELASLTREVKGLLLVFLSGGGSAMLAMPSEDLTIDEKRQTVAALLRAGVPISDVNCVRKHLSAIKGGRLACAADGRCLTLAISDVPQPPDDPGTIASGPTAADPTTFHDALKVVTARGRSVPVNVRTYLKRGAAGELVETPKVGDPRLRRASFDVIGNRKTSMQQAALAAIASGYHVSVIDEAIAGEASQAGPAFVDLAVRRLTSSKPACVIASGETTVTVRSEGIGGRNQEFVAAASRALADLEEPAVVLSAGTDGIDGPTDAAGGIVTSMTRADAAANHVDLDAALARNDTYPALDALGALVRLGPTLTNVGDLHLFLRA